MGGTVRRSTRRRAQLVVLAAAERFVAPRQRLVARPRRSFVWPPDSGAADGRPRPEHTDGHVLLELGAKLSYLVPRATSVHGGGPSCVHHRVRAPEGSAACVALEPFQYLQRHLLGVAVLGDVDVQVAGYPCLDLGVLVVGDTLTVDGVSFGFTTYLEPAVVDITADDGARRCALCRGPLRPGNRAVRCVCGALLHAGATPPFDSFEAQHLCADVGPCPDCCAELPRTEGHEWLPTPGGPPACPPLPAYLRSRARELELAPSSTRPGVTR
jgi:hypothetical protein